MISNEQHPSELHETEIKQKVNKQVERDLMMRTDYINDRHDNLDVQSYIRYPTIGQTQNLYFDKRHHRTNSHRASGNIHPQVILKDELISIQGMSLDVIILTNIMHHTK